MSDPQKLSPGDLAIIIKSIDGLSIGKIVSCKEIAVPNHPKYGVVWLVTSPRADLVTEYGGVGDNFHVPQDWLRKIPNDPLPDEGEVIALLNSKKKDRVKDEDLLET